MKICNLPGRRALHAHGDSHWVKMLALSGGASGMALGGRTAKSLGGFVLLTTAAALVGAAIGVCCTGGFTIVPRLDDSGPPRKGTPFDFPGPSPESP